MKTLYAMLIPLIFGGCALLNAGDPSQSLAIKLGTATFIEAAEDIEARACKIIEESKRVTVFVDSNSFAISELKPRLIKRIASLEISYSEMLIATAFIDHIESYILAKTNRDVLDTEDLVTLNWALGIIIETASIYAGECK